MLGKQLSLKYQSTWHFFSFIHHNGTSRVKYNNLILPLILDTDKISVALVWRGDRAPEIKGWLDTLLEVKRMEKQLGLEKREIEVYEGRLRQ